MLLTQEFSAINSNYKSNFRGTPRNKLRNTLALQTTVCRRLVYPLETSGSHKQHIQNFVYNLTHKTHQTYTYFRLYALTVKA